MGSNYTRIDSRICWVLDRLAPYKSPLALDSLLFYQQSSSTTLYYSYLGMPDLIEIRLRNEIREITCVNALVRVTHLSFLRPGDVASTTGNC